MIELVVVSSEEEFWSFLRSGYTPYLMKSQNRWYFRRGQKRHIIERELEELARKVATKLKAERGEPIRASILQEMRIRGALIEDLAEDTGLSQNAVYGAFERKSEELVKPRTKALPRILKERREEKILFQEVNRLLKDISFLGKIRREKKGCFNVDEGVCTHGISSEVGGLELVKHEHPAPIPLLPPAIDYHFKPSLELCAICPIDHEHGFDSDIIEACLQVSKRLNNLSGK